VDCLSKLEIEYTSITQKNKKYMRRTKKKITKKKKKFFIILACYLATFIITSVVTSATLAWFNGSTWQSDMLYMGGPVYIHFADDSENPTSGRGKLVTETPPGWSYLYPGMNINFQAKAVVEGKKFQQQKPWGETVEYFTTGAVLRARIMLEITDKNGSSSSFEAQKLYNWIWPQLKQEALNDKKNNGVWIYDPTDTDQTPGKEENYYFYYCVSASKEEDGVQNYLQEVGGVDYNVSVGFLNNCVIQMPSIDLTNDYADCTITFTIVFEAVQAFFPYEQSEVGVKEYQGDTTNRSPYVQMSDVGLEKPLTIGNSRKIFNESRWSSYISE